MTIEQREDHIVGYIELINEEKETAVFCIPCAFAVDADDEMDSIGFVPQSIVRRVTDRDDCSELQCDLCDRSGEDFYPEPDFRASDKAWAEQLRAEGKC